MEPWDLFSPASRMTFGKLKGNFLNNPAQREHWGNRFQEDFPKWQTIPGKVISGNLTDRFHHIPQFRRIPRPIIPRPIDPQQMILTISLDIQFLPTSFLQTEIVYITGTALFPSKGDTIYDNRTHATTYATQIVSNITMHHIDDFPVPVVNDDHKCRRLHI